MVNVANVWKIQANLWKSLILKFGFFHRRVLYDGPGEAIHPTIVAVNIPICYKYAYQS